jgi:peptidoglycan/xylan/chitin deacetylase (PgdA/CDA1 family)
LPDPAAGGDELLRPLRAILDTLEARGARGVFYFTGPGNRPDARAFLPIHRDAITEIHHGGHVLGYHAYAHEPLNWMQFVGQDERIESRIRADLARLEAYLDEVLIGAGLARERVFSPLFRQPYGGAGVSAGSGACIAREFGWTTHGFLIDAGDWVVNADATVLAPPAPFTDDASRVDFVKERLRAGAARQAGRATVDVLMHVNHLTAAHLDEWIDTLDEAFAQTTGFAPGFNVPSDYLETENLILDESALGAIWTLNAR